eukprot:CAMPEP_0167787750 /NCGR_PEP_ID=MMETSP0111_2-20121227/9623_1 /TAXON_ID=91324 /ORGANISM="Lotharella globosa, Strain CCCM811" /LENGTH=351 /DNA_ID=CAMNT_0007679481 /DNA_START=163 /DNA_END=1218 /DNA_ORIENTATION=+
MVFMGRRPGLFPMPKGNKIRNSAASPPSCSCSETENVFRCVSTVPSETLHLAVGGPAVARFTVSQSAKTTGNNLTWTSYTAFNLETGGYTETGTIQFGAHDVLHYGGNTTREIPGHNGLVTVAFNGAITHGSGIFAGYRGSVAYVDYYAKTMEGEWESFYTINVDKKVPVQLEELAAKRHSTSDLPSGTRITVGQLEEGDHFKKHLEFIASSKRGPFVLMGVTTDGHCTADVDNTENCVSYGTSDNMASHIKGQAGLSFSLQEEVGKPSSVAEMALETHDMGGSSEFGTLHFGKANSLSYSSIAADWTTMRGKIVRGTGVFAGRTGAIAYSRPATLSTRSSYRSYFVAVVN